MLIDLGFNFGLVRYTALNKKNLNYKNILFNSVLFLVLILSTITICIFFSILNLEIIIIKLNLDKNLIYIIYILTINVIINLIISVFGNYLFGLGEFVLWKSISIFHTTLNILLLLIVYQYNLNIKSYINLILINSLIILVINILIHYIKGYRINFKYCNFKILKRLYKVSSSSFINSLINKIINYSDTLIIAFFWTVNDVARYELIYKLCFLSTYSFSLFSTILFPTMVEKSKNYIYKIRYIAIKNITITMAIYYFITIFIFFNAEKLIEIWVGEGNYAGDKILIILLLINLVHAIGATPSVIVQALTSGRRFMYSEIFNAILNIVLSILLLKLIGLVGVPIGTLLSYLLTSGWYIPYIAFKKLKIKLTSFLKITILNFIKLIIILVIANVIYIKCVEIKEITLYLIINLSLNLSLFYYVYKKELKKLNLNFY